MREGRPIIRFVFAPIALHTLTTKVYESGAQPAATAQRLCLSRFYFSQPASTAWLTYNVRQSKMFTDYPKDGILDGALFWDAKDLSTHPEIVGIVREGDRLCVVKKKSAHFVLEFLKKESGAPQWAYPVWSEARTSIVCGSDAEAFDLTKPFLAEVE